ncbi:protein serrate-like [Penaeus japonicus]|uniref:protein serrate-like n=1 Tax=Penaeus japonicus TaxID=27405 RepID=UPI001C716567|nr:protein serrate-like [Penaeus japonicus]
MMVPTYPGLPRGLLWLRRAILLAAFVQVATGSGRFELEVMEVQNSHSQLWSGECCGGVARAPGSECPVQCRTVVALCLKEYQSTQDGGTVLPRQVLESGSLNAKGQNGGAGGWGGCTYGNGTSPVLGGSSFTLAQLPPAAHIHLPFTFSWTPSVPDINSRWQVAALWLPKVQGKAAVGASRTRQQSHFYGAYYLLRRPPVFRRSSH